MKKEMMDQEQMHLDEVEKRIAAELKREQRDLDKQKGELVEERQSMWEECAHAVATFDDVINLAAYDERVREKFGHFVRKSEMVRQLSYLRETPYFGRIDFREEGEPDVKQIYIGRYGLCDRETYEYEIYDWRTPIASMFYDCMLGEASYKCPMGEIGGELRCKRQYKIEKGNLKYCYDTNLAIQDEMLGKVLSENTDKVLRVIIDTITREQNQAIRQPQAVDCLITGPAGSGKTSVGMHRLAYLLYHNRDSLTSDKIAVLSRNQIFSSYVAGILPELGEENVHDVVFDSLISRGIPKEYKKKGYYEQAEYLLEHGEDTLRRCAVRLKYSAEFLGFVKENLKLQRGKNTDAEAAINVYLELLRQYTGERNKEIYGYTRAKIYRKRLYYEDMLLVGYVRILLGGIRPMEQISHVVLDEAQDYSRPQLLIMRALYPKSRFTILADVNQAVYPETSTTDLEVFRQIFGDKLQEITLPKSYRSTAPINRYAFGILGVRNPNLYMDRPGKEPERFETEDMAATLAELLRQTPPEKSVGVFTCDRETAVSIKIQLGKTLSGTERKIQYILRPDNMLEEKTVIMPVLLAKGLEFDTVIVWDDKPETYWEENKNLKYLMCTRALHELYFVSEKKQLTTRECGGTL